MANILTSWAATALLKFSRFHASEIRGERFLKLAEDARQRIVELPPQEAAIALWNGAALIDVREKDEFQRGHIAQALHLPRGTIELEVEKHFPESDTEILLYCGAGRRSALAADMLQRMGYTNVKIIAGGLEAWIHAGHPARQSLRPSEDEL